MYPLLSFLIFFPIFGSLLLLFIKNKDEVQLAKNAKNVALWISLIELVFATLLLSFFTGDTSGIQLEENYAWIPQFDIFYKLGVDGISILFIYLTALLTPLCVLLSWESIKDKIPQFLAAFLALEGLVIGVFCALDTILFYVFWEAMLIPMFLIIGIWGGENRIYATLKFFLYTFAGSILMLIAIIYMKVATGSSDILELQHVAFDPSVQYWLFIAFFAAFAVKVPMWPFHTWLPDAHVQAPAAGSVILAGVLLKMGAYGFLRFNLPMFPDATQYFTPLMILLSVIAIVYAALVAFSQTDIKKMIAYSSVSHMGFVTLGIFANTQTSVEGAVLQMVNHGIVSAALFMLIGLIYDRTHTRDLNKLGGLVQPMPVYAAIFMIFMLASVALPGTNSFIGEFMILSGSFSVLPVAVAIACSGVVLGALYMLWLYRYMIMGEPKEDLKLLPDLNLRERIIFFPLVFLVFFMGIFPNISLKIFNEDIKVITQEKMSKLEVLSSEASHSVHIEEMKGH